MGRTSFIGILMKVDIFGEPIAANYINYKKKRNFKTNIGGFMTIATCFLVLIYTVTQLRNLFGHQAFLDQ